MDWFNWYITEIIFVVFYQIAYLLDIYGFLYTLILNIIFLIKGQTNQFEINYDIHFCTVSFKIIIKNLFQILFLLNINEQSKTENKFY